ncbi:MAG: Tat pathway signal protein [Anaerolineaceae bacterium]|nr:Tat pathway signal protein [Anaerolineaceae bacterium]
MGTSPKLINSYLLHLGYNMWADREVPDAHSPYIVAKPYLRCDKSLWNDVLHRMVQIGMNLVVIDLGEGVKYDSHPELAVIDSWTPQELRAELVRIRQMGLEPIPKLNFSTCHDAWLGPYSRMVSTRAYYDVCKELIAEVTSLFDKPRFFHIGMDEETARHQRNFEYAVMRQYDLWWHDLYFLLEQVEKNGSRPWMWADYAWEHYDEFYARMPKSVLQSNWYYGAEFGPELQYVKTYVDLEKHGYDQVPTGSMWSNDVNFGGTVEFCRQYIAPERLLGFMQTVWHPTLEECRPDHVKALDQVAAALG